MPLMTVPVHNYEGASRHRDKPADASTVHHDSGLSMDSSRETQDWNQSRGQSLKIDRGLGHRQVRRQHGFLGGRCKGRDGSERSRQSCSLAGSEEEPWEWGRHRDVGGERAVVGIAVEAGRRGGRRTINTVARGGRRRRGVRGCRRDEDGRCEGK
jgi:hypothetical protein